MNFGKYFGMVVFAVLAGGCANPSVQTGYTDMDSPPGSEQAEQPASLFEMNFGGGETEVTKNIPAAAAKKVGDSIRSVRGKPNAENATE